jgi:GAF domain-containing protein
MASETLSAVQMTDQTINVLLQQLFNQIAALDSITDAVADILAANQSTNATAESSMGATTTSPLSSDILTTVQHSIDLHKQDLHLSSQRLQQRVRQLEILYAIANQYGEASSLDRVLTTAMDAVWQKARLGFVVIILGETELGPYFYHSMRGVPNAWQYVQHPCPFPLWGILARALLPRLNPDEPDYLVVKNIAKENLPLPEEFPWLPRTGSLMILPLRVEKRASGAILLGSPLINAFADRELCVDYLAIAEQTAHMLQLTQMHHELNERAGQLLSLQLFTKSIAAAHNYDKLVDVLVEGIFEAMGRVGVSIIFNNQVWQRTTDGLQTPRHHSQRIIEWAMQAGQPIFYDPEDSEGSLERFYYNDSGHALVVPIVRNERTEGAIQITSDSQGRRFEEGDLIVLRTIANCAAIMLRTVDA